MGLADRAVPSPPIGGQRFGRDARVLTPAAFDRCLRRPALWRDGPFALHLCPPDAVSDAPPCWRLGLVIPKRYEASAVARNTIKRRWRDAFRRGRLAWASEFGSADLVVRMQSPLVPKPPKVAKPARAKDAASRSRPPAAGVAPNVAPAQTATCRARERFDPASLLTAMTNRLRARGFPAARPTVRSTARPAPPPR